MPPTTKTEYLNDKLFTSKVLQYKRSQELKEELVRKLNLKRDVPLTDDEIDRLEYKGKMSKVEVNELGEMVLTLVFHISLDSKFRNYTYLDDMKSHAYYSIWKYIRTFKEFSEKTDEETGKTYTIKRSAFNYFTSATMNAFKAVLNKEKTVRERRKEFQERDYLNRINQPNNEHLKDAKKKCTSETQNNRMTY